MGRRARSPAAVCALALAVAACGGPAATTGGAGALPVLHRDEVTEPAVKATAPAIVPGDATAAVLYGNARTPHVPVTLTATGASLRSVLIGLAEQAGVSLALGADVQGRISVHFEEVPALEALLIVLEEAGLGVSGRALAAPWGPVVFYQLPVDVNEAGAETIRARFGVSSELARWFVKARSF